MALVLAPEVPLENWLGALDAQMERSPNFFDARPVVVDLGPFRGSNLAWRNSSIFWNSEASA